MPVPNKPAEYANQASMPINVLLTRSIGSGLLQVLLNRDGIAHVFCLKCGEDGGKAKQYKIFTTSRFASTKPEIAHLNQKEHKYKPLNENINLIVHAAWLVNFNLVLSAFHSQFVEIVHLLSLAVSTNYTIRFVLISPIAAVEKHTAGPVPRAIISNLKTPMPFSYASAKFLSRLLVDAAD
ncbi:putative ochratoxin a non-ribosomal peptide synthetase protein [Botrytis fragariae]|uniref:Putative ochratoxin a non-ribosomal peptide synthetase protein n=1 Tax=Botrytis fragariae TaxID=1964551 RepID=A0A8H6EG13_9HELO|nr:putative ochratoxin a non-ribosomal peptide synthetase protein [Botrytis fragariae]KAF5870932.1 putative ochratoxin a non-ribosomal peptide synthetase protein [Botrytis fragariae]